MPTTLANIGTTFVVDDVTPVGKEFPQRPSHEVLPLVLGGPLESCSDYFRHVVEGVHYHPLLAAVHIAFANHRPLSLSPDHVWITIAQGVAHHMAIHGERLRPRFVAHRGKVDLVYQCRDWAELSPENPWPAAFAGWADQIREHVGGETHDALLCDFSTSGDLERAVSRVVMMDVFQRYFHFVAYCICGIPTITLEGTPADWERLAGKAAALRVFDLDWWLADLLPICEQFVRASRGDVDRRHWQRICKLEEAYGGDIINGWIARLFPYLRAYTDGPCDRRNPIFETGEGFQSLSAPSGLSRVPFTWINALTGRSRRMETIAGLTGVTQDPDTGALRPHAGWAVRPAPKLDVLLARLSEEHVTTAGFLEGPAEVELPNRADIGAFYHRTNGAQLKHGGVQTCRIVPAAEQVPLDWGEMDREPWDANSRGPGGRLWHRLAWLPDGSYLAMNLDLNLHNAPWYEDERFAEFRRNRGDITPICHASAATQGQPGQNSVVALSFTELLEKLLSGDGRPYLLTADFTSYGDAELFTRR